jgi:hypothetical protein
LEQDEDSLAPGFDLKTLWLFNNEGVALLADGP